MSRRHRNDPRPGHEDYLPLNDAERRAHADALALSHAGHDCPDRAANLQQAGEYYAMLGDYDLAEQMFREALDLDDDGMTRALYASFLLERHRDEEAFAMITEVRRLRPRNPDVFSVLGETLADFGHQQQAARWFTAGLVAQAGYLADLTVEDLRDDFDARLLAGGRYLARQALELPEDHIDTAVRELRGTEAVSSAGE